jgi:hypothetical protein
LVWPAIVLIRPTTSPIFCAASDRLPTISLVRRAFSTACWIVRDDCSTCRPISAMEAASSSAAAATVWTLEEAWSAALATALACWVACWAAEDMVVAVAVMSPDDVAT